MCADTLQAQINTWLENRDKGAPPPMSDDFNKALEYKKSFGFWNIKDINILSLELLIVAELFLLGVCRATT